MTRNAPKAGSTSTFPALGALMLAVTLAGCGAPAASLSESLEARRLAADLRVQFAKMVDAGNRAVMVGDDKAAADAARDATAAAHDIEGGLDRLSALLDALRYEPERAQLETFRQPFSEYRALDGDVLPLAAENTNLKAQRLSFGPAREAAKRLRAALDRVVASAPSARSATVRELACDACTAVLQVLVIHAPHIAEAEDAAMTMMERDMEASLSVARKDLAALEAEAAPRGGADVTAALDALDEFSKLNAEIVSLSRRNSNVRSLALSLGRKRTLAALCDDRLRQLNDALAAHAFGATR